MKQILVPDVVLGPDGPAPACRTKRQQAWRSVHEQKRGSMNLLERTPHARTHVIPPRIHARPFSVFVLESLPFSLSLSQNAIRMVSRIKFFGVSKAKKSLFKKILKPYVLLIFFKNIFWIFWLYRIAKFLHD